jgi:hypothetical protein
MNIIERRKAKLKHDGFMSWEIRQLSQYPITSPEMQALRRERKDLVRTAKELGQARPILNQQIRSMYRAEGLYSTHKKRYDLSKLVLKHKERELQREREVELSKEFKVPIPERIAVGMSTSDKQALSRAGFESYEIDEYAHATTPSGNPQKIDISKPTWTIAIQQRTAIREHFFSEGRKHGLRYTKIYAEWLKFLRLFNPFEWIRGAVPPEDARLPKDFRSQQYKRKDFIRGEETRRKLEKRAPSFVKFKPVRI